MKTLLESTYSISYESLNSYDKKSLLVPTLISCGFFFALYYIFLIIPKFGITSEVFFIDSIGGAFIVGSFIAATILSRYVTHDIIFMLPSFGAIATSILFLRHEHFYSEVNHLWLSAQMISIIFAIFLGTPKLNVILFILNVTIPLLVAWKTEHLIVQDIVSKQAVVYFASIISIFLSHRFETKKRDLLNARDKALNAEKAKSQFLANMSHEIRTPMNGVLGNAEILLDEELSEIQRRHVKIILNSGTNMLNLLNDILDYSKIESGQLRTENRNFDIRSLLHSITDLYEFSASTKNLHLSLNIAKNLPDFIVSDSTRIQQIVSNLISNSIKFTRVGGITLNATSTQLSNESHEISITVSDTGIGIPKDKIDMIFEDFTQSDNTITRKYGGTGLGLSISKKLALALGGEISVASEENSGSQFTLRIPCELGQREIYKQRVSSNEPLDLSDKKILLIEDNLINRDLAINFLKDFGATIDEANNGLEGLALANEVKYDFILMDCQMPVMDGFRSTKEIRKLSGDHQPIIIAMTANAMRGDREACLEAGMNDYLSKPISKSKLKETLKKWNYDKAAS